MKSAQTSQDAPPDPTGKPTLGRIPRRGDADARGGVEGHELVVEAVVEAVEERGAAGDDDVGEEVGADVRVDLAEGCLNEGRERLSLWWGRVVRVLPWGEGGVSLNDLELDDLVQAKRGEEGVG